MQEMENQQINFRIRVISICFAALSLLLVLFVEAEWALGLRSLSSFGKNFVPMAEETAIVIILLAIASILLVTSPTKQFVRGILLVFNLISITVAILSLIDIITNYQFNLSDFIQQESNKVNGIILGRMSYVTAICIIFSSISQLFILKNKQQLSVAYSILVFVIAYLVIVGYSYGVPFFYTGGITPMSWPTSFGFLFLSVAQVFAAGKNCMPICLFIGNSTGALMMRKLIPIVCIVMLVQNFADLYFLNEHSTSAALVSGLIDITKMIVVGLAISIVSKRVGHSIDQNILELKLSQAKVNQLMQAVENSPATIIITDLNGNIVYVNKKFEEISGYTKEEVLGNKPNILKSGHTSNEEYRILWQSITNGQSWKGEFHNKRKNGSLYWEAATIYPIKNNREQVIQFMAIKEDITEQKKSIDKLKNIAWQQSHEIRGPLTSIMGIIGVINLSTTVEEKMALLSSLDEAAKKLDLAIRAIVDETQN